MRRALTTGLFNKRGVHGFSHGEEEKQIAADYRQKAKALADNGFNRVADVVRGLAENFGQDAERESHEEIYSMSGNRTDYFSTTIRPARDGVK